jgi:hypothetical protein
MATTRNSDFTDTLAMFNVRQAGGNPDRRDFQRPVPNRAYTIDLCTWAWKQHAQDSWAIFDGDRIERAMSANFITRLVRDQTPMDSIPQTFGCNLLHEVRLSYLQSRGYFDVAGSFPNLSTRKNGIP